MSAMQQSTLSLYGDCVDSLRASLSFLESSVATLDAGVADFPRLESVLKTVRHYELVPQPTLAAAEASLQSEIGPSVAALLDRAETQLARQARRIDTLQARAALQAGRLEGQAATKSATTTAKPTAKTARTAKQSMGADALRARMTRQRREQLKYSIQRLEREVAQKERELRQRLQSTSALA
ncbi:mitotic spindle biogenesis protein [Grosmannia clavigera kw1407]|uniref:DASH complex subunit SPC19 n=1 Tax=Grosmannia clavigera (strain kw1407 / UAMH 11150) TaxID=655863 RepID=F0XKA1_GROCL|nr:mitotic spindle biogenesis protein [Grosmannia clavigera kw1407]EFX01980.1 mitotic spindle biogenesis protein [Grosmannia clavigera kw1407]